MGFPLNVSAKELGVDGFSPDSVEYQNALKVAENLQAIRDFYNPERKKDGVKINVHIGYRSPEKNQEVGGAERSQHLNASAVDFSLYGFSLATVYNDVMNGKIKLPHTVSQLIIEESNINKGKWGWLHLGVYSKEWADARKKIGKNNKPNQFLIARNKKVGKGKDYTVAHGDVI